MSFDQPNLRPLPPLLRLAGAWLVWSAWCSTSGWLLSAAHHLDGFGYLALLPALLLGEWFWLKRTGPMPVPLAGLLRKTFRRMRKPAPFVYFLVAGLSLLGGLLYAPWTADATLYRLPRTLYWWWAQHWYWIGTLDHRLDFASTGFEWQMLPVIILTRSDRLLFLLNWVPFLLAPGLLFMTFRALGVGGRAARRWMWLWPCAYCVALQSGSVQNDAYAANYALACVVFAVWARVTRRTGLALLAILAAALLTGAKVSNLPLLLPLGFVLLPALGLLLRPDWRVPAVLAVAALCSFLPMAGLSWKITGDWTGDPSDQWSVKPRNPVGALAANLVYVAKDAVQPPYLPGAGAINAHLKPFNDTGLIQWMRRSHGEFKGVHFGQMPYEGNSGPGFGMGFYLLALAAGCLLLKRAVSPTRPSPPLHWSVWLAPWLVWASYLVFLCKLGSDQTVRIGVQYYPLLLAGLLRLPRVAAFERTRFSSVAAPVAAALVIPVMLFTPARPLVPMQAIAKAVHKPALSAIAEQYAYWDYIRDSVAPIRAQLPAEAAKVGYGGGYLDPACELAKPFGSREIVELGLPLGSGKVTVPGLKYAVVTERGLRERMQLDLKTWLERADGEIIFTNQRNVMLDAHSAPKYESWYLVRLNADTNHLATPHADAR